MPASPLGLYGTSTTIRGHPTPLNRSWHHGNIHLFLTNCRHVLGDGAVIFPRSPFPRPLIPDLSIPLPPSPIQAVQASSRQCTMGNAACPKRLDIYWVRRPRRSRSRTGCDSCRARRRKCDEERPICGFCRTYNLQCTRAAPPPKKGLSAAVVPTSPSEVAVSTTEQQVQGAQELPPVEAHISRPLNVSQRGTPRLGAINGPNETFAPAWHPPADFFETNEASPSLADLRDLEQHLFESGILLDHASPGSSSGTSEDIVASKGPNATMLFNHFCYKTVPWLLYSDRHDSLILQHIVPQAITDPLVLLTLLAVSGIHLRQLQPSIEAEALEYYASALSHLNGILSDRLRSQRTGYRSLLTTLILLCHYEVSVLLSPSPEWQGLKIEPL